MQAPRNEVGLGKQLLRKAKILNLVKWEFERVRYGSRFGVEEVGKRREW